ncbi:unnamed protein product [Clavelina lepadiformis]|uniref:GB1/RHD3-type G domain-containing protein n=1 Tax=Clavelina lepadiformis TaxID=159417 RepID=A0ABP0FGK6_CLALP
MMAQAVQIFCIKKGKLEFHHNAFEEVFSQKNVSNTPIAIYSIAGKLREGKSFLLNLFMKYLDDKKCPEWLSKSEEKIIENFDTRYGEDPCTDGIWILNKPFFLTTEEEKKVAVFLMDTQGTFEPGSTIQGTSIIFALSLLISSFQMYNIKSKVDQSDFDHLKIFIDYARMAQRTSQSHSVAVEPFQSLMFLIRDWIYDEGGLEKGKEKLDKWLNPCHSEIQDQGSIPIQSKFRDFFADLSCFLMPEPGNKVIIRKDKTLLKLQDLELKFRDKLDELVKYLFDKNIVAKKVNGEIITGEVLLKYFAACEDVFQNVNLKNANSVAQAGAEVAMVVTLNNKLTEWQEEWQAYRGKYINQQKLDELHATISKKILDKFDALPKLGDDDFIAKSTQKLIDAMTEKFNTVKTFNNLQKENTKKHLLSFISSASKKLQEMYYEKSGRTCFQEESNFKKVIATCKNEAVIYYNEQAKEFDEELVENNQPAFDSNLNISIQEIHMHNLQLKEELMIELREKMTSAMQHYQVQMEKVEVYSLSPPAYENKHKAARNGSFDMFNGIRKGENTQMWKECYKELEQYISQQRDFAESRRKSFLDADKTIHDLMKKGTDYFKEWLNGECGMDCVDLSKIQRYSKQARINTTNYLQSLQTTEDVPPMHVKSCVDKLGDVLDVEVENEKNKVALRKSKMREDLRKKANEIAEKYRTTLKSQLSKSQAANPNYDEIKQQFVTEALNELGACEAQGFEEEHQAIKSDLHNRVTNDFNWVIISHIQTLALETQKKVATEEKMAREQLERDIREMVEQAEQERAARRKAERAKKSGSCQIL